MEKTNIVTSGDLTYLDFVKGDPFSSRKKHDVVVLKGRVSELGPGEVEGVGVGGGGGGGRGMRGRRARGETSCD